MTHLMLPVALVAFAVPASSSHAQPVRGSINAAQNGQATNSIPANVRSSNNAGQFRDQIAAFFDAQVAELNRNVGAATAAKDRIAQQVAGETSSSFRDEFARVMVEKLRPALEEQDPFLRLNSAIAVAQVANATQSPRLIPLIEDLVSDSNPGVSLQGIKAAEAVLAASVQQSPPGREPLTPQIVESVERNLREGPLADEAYRALLLRVLGSSRPSDMILDRGVPQVVPATLDLIEMRLELYGPPENEGELPQLPPMPLAENQAVLLLTYPVIWPRQDQETQMRTIRVLRDLMVTLRDATLDAADAVNAADPEERQARTVVRQDLTGLLKRTALALQTIASRSRGGDAANQLQNAAQQVANLPVVVQNSVLEQEVNALVDAVSNMYPDLPAPPESTRGDENGAGAADDATPASDAPAGE